MYVNDRNVLISDAVKVFIHVLASDSKSFDSEDILEQQEAWMIAQKIREEKAQYEEEDKKEEADGNDEDKHHQPESGDSYLDSMD